jgi:hypothetical protein
MITGIDWRWKESGANPSSRRIAAKRSAAVGEFRTPGYSSEMTLCLIENFITLARFSSPSFAIMRPR